MLPSDLNNFTELVNCIVNYYRLSSSFEQIDSSEAWKRNANLIKSAVPDEIDKRVKSSFIYLLDVLINELEIKDDTEVENDTEDDDDEDEDEELYQ